MESSILTKVAAGDAAAVQECIEAFGGLVWSLARRMSSSPEDAEDAVQEIFVDLWRHAGRYDPGKGSESAFTATIARRRLIDRNRRDERRRQAQPASQVPPETLASDLRDQQQQAALCEEARLARQILAELRPEQRRVLQMAILEGRTHKQISLDTGMPLGTVKSHVRRGLEQVRTRLQRPAGGTDTADTREATR